MERIRHIFIYCFCGAMFVSLSSCTWLKTKDAQLTVYNAKPYEVYAAVHYTKDIDSSFTRTYTLSPGEIVNLSVDFIGVEPNFYLYSRPSANSSEFKDWLFHPEHFYKKATIPKDETTYDLNIGTSSFGGKQWDSHTSSFGDGLYQSTDISTNSRDHFPIPVDENYVGPIAFKASTAVGWAEERLSHVLFSKVLIESSWGNREAHSLLRDDREAFVDIYSSSLDTDNISEKYSRFASNAWYKNYTLKQDFIQTGTFTLKNAAPYKLAVAINYQFSRDSSATEGWYHIDAGDQLEISRQFRGIKPHLDVFAKSSAKEQDLILNIFEDAEEYISVKYFQPQFEEAKIFKPIHETEVFDYRTLATSEEEDPLETITVAFVDGIYAENVSGDIHLGSYTFYDLDFPSIFDHEYIENPEEFHQVSLSKAKELHRSLENKLEDDELFDVYILDSPVVLGLTLTDYNGFSNLGVVVKDHYEKDIFGNRTPFQVGDIITSFDGQNVFGIHDLRVPLYKHATSLSGGIAKPIAFTAIRGDQKISGQTTYRFNRSYTGWPKDESSSAFWAGARDAITWGFDDEMYKILVGQNEWEGWRYLQKKIRLKQFYSGAYLRGNFGGTIISPGRLVFQKALKKTLVKSGINRSLSRIMSASLLEGAENVLWTIGNRSPSATETQFIEEMIINGRDGMLFGLAFASADIIRKY